MQLSIPLSAERPLLLCILNALNSLLQALFLGKLNQRELARLWERLLKFVLFKIVFVGAVVSPKVPELMVLISW
jgi:autocrine motility factor receptor